MYPSPPNNRRGDREDNIFPNNYNALTTSDDDYDDGILDEDDDYDDEDDDDDDDTDDDDTYDDNIIPQRTNPLTFDLNDNINPSPLLQLFWAYCKKDIEKMATIILSIDNFNFQSFIELRSKYIGSINNNSNDDIIVFNSILFNAALYTNSPSIIDDSIKHINNFNFTTLNIPHDQIDCIKQQNAINFRLQLGHGQPRIYISNNDMISIIVDTIQHGYGESILYLINNYQLSPTIPIYDYSHPTIPIMNLFYYATNHKNNHKLLQYLLPLCFDSTLVHISQILENLSKHGHLVIIQQLQNQYNVNLTVHSHKILQSAFETNNIELLDYIVSTCTTINLNDNISNYISTAIHYGHYDIIKHVITKYKEIINIQFAPNPLNSFDHYFHNYDRITPDMIDLIFQTFPMAQRDLNNLIYKCKVLTSFAKEHNCAALKHFVEKYNIRPVFSPNYRGDSLLHCALLHINRDDSSKVEETVEYLIKSGVDVNQRGINDRQTPIQLILSSYVQNDAVTRIFALLLQNNAEIGDIYTLLTTAIKHSCWSIVQYLLETYQPKIDIKRLFSPSTGYLFHQAVCSDRPSLDFIKYLISSHNVDINQQYRNDTPLHLSQQHSRFHSDVIKLLISHGATVSNRDWREIFINLISTDELEPDQFFQSFEYFQMKIQQLSPSLNMSNFADMMFTVFRNRHFNFIYSKIKTDADAFGQIIIYRALVHRYQFHFDKDIFHDLAVGHWLPLIPFTLQHIHQKPKIYYLEDKGKTFLHKFILNTDTSRTRSTSHGLEWMKVEYQSDDLMQHFEFVLDAIIDREIMKPE